MTPRVTTQAHPATPAPEEPEQDQRPVAHTSAELFHACHQLAALLDSAVPQTAAASQQRRAAGVNPSTGRTASGLYLELRHGYPESLWTPWGRWPFAARPADAPAPRLDSAHRAAVEGFLSEVGATEYHPVVPTSEGAFGPVYALHSIAGAPLDAPGILLPRATDDEHAHAIAEWRALRWSRQADASARAQDQGATS